MQLLFALGLGTILMAFSLFTERLTKGKKLNFQWLSNFSLGLSITVVFLQFLPDVFNGTELGYETIFTFIFLGFTSFLILETAVRKKAAKNKKTKKTIAIESSCIYTESFVEGMLIYLFIGSKPITEGIVLISPLILSGIASTLVLTEVYKNYKKNKWTDIYFESFILLGILFAFMISSQTQTAYAAYAFIQGAFLYLTIHDIAPTKNKIQLKPFLTGTAISITIIAAVNLFIILQTFNG